MQLWIKSYRDIFESQRGILPVNQMKYESMLGPVQKFLLLSLELLSSLVVKREKNANYTVFATGSPSKDVINLSV